MPSPERYTQAKRVYLEAERLPKGERSKFIRAQCGEDPELETQVRRLLTAEEEPEFLETPALGRAHEVGPGTMLGRFRIVRQLGEGGMGTVYEAEEDEPRRRIALKVIRSGALSERLRSRFRHEIRVLGQLRHPGIAQIYEAGTLKLGGDLVPFFSMELIQGPPLLQFARDRALGLRDRLALIAQICDAAHHAHQKAVIHRDLKPGNILVEESPTTDASGTSTAVPFQIKVLDFGIARVADTQARTASIQTEPGQLVGTVPYMSPEQVSGQSDSVDIRSDVYSIGVIAFELLADRLPYAIRDRLLPEAVRMIHETEPTRLGSIDRTFRGDIETIIGKALEKDRQHRYQSAADMAADIRRFLRDEPIVARPASALYQIRKFARRNRPLVVAACLVLVAMIAATSISMWQARVALRAKSLAEGEKTRADLSADAARRQALRATISAVQASIDSGDPIAARRLLNDTDIVSRGWPWRYSEARLDQSIAVVTAPADVTGAWLSPNGDEIAIVARDGSILRGSPWAVSRVATLAGKPCIAAAFTADGSRVAAITGPTFKSLHVYDTRDGNPIEHVADLPYRGTLVEISADGGLICAGVKRTSGIPAADDVWVWSGGQGRQVRAHARTSGLALTPDGRFLVAGFSTTVVLDLSTGTESTETDPLSIMQRFAVSDDGSLLASGGEGKAVRVWKRGSNDSIELRGHAGSITALAFDHAGKRLVSAADDLTIRYWDADTGRPLAVLSGHAGPVRGLVFSADDSCLLSVSDDKTARLWKPDARDLATVLRGHSSFVYAVAFTPDGREIVSASWDKTIRTWDAASGKSLRVIPAGEGFLTAVAVSHDGGTFAAAHITSDWELGSISLWNRGGDELRRLPPRKGEVDDLIFSRDGSRLWGSWRADGVGVVDVQTSARRTLAKAGSPKALAISPDESEMAIGLSDGSIRICDASTGQVRKTLTGHTDWVVSLCYHPTRRLLASASNDRTARLWNLDTGACRAVLDRHWDKVYAAAFSPDGQILATGSNDTTIMIWDVESGEELTLLRGHNAYVYSLAFSPDGRMLASGSGDSTVRVWDTRPVHERWRAAQSRP